MAFDVEWRGESRASCGVIGEKEREAEGDGSWGFRAMVVAVAVAATAGYHPTFRAAETGGVVTREETRRVKSVRSPWYSTAAEHEATRRVYA